MEYPYHSSIAPRSQPHTAIVTGKAKKCTDQQGRNQPLPIAASREGAKAAHEGTGAEIKQAKAGDYAHYKGNEGAPHTPFAQGGHHIAQRNDRQTAQNTGQIWKNRLFQTQLAMGTAGKIGRTAGKACPAD